MRIPSHFAGTVFPKDEAENLAFFEKALAATPAPEKHPLHRPPVIITPHIDFRVDLQSYAIAYHRLLQRTPFPDTIILLGVGHHCPADFSCIPTDYEMPLGLVETDGDLFALLRKHCPVSIEHHPESFPGEHSLEFVVAWLQALALMSGKRRPFKILPILMGGVWESIEKASPPGPDSDFMKFATAFGKMTESLDPKRTAIIASIDGCHVGPRFQHPFPVDEQVRTLVEQWETLLWSNVRSDRLEDFFKVLGTVGNQFYFDGVGVLSLLLLTWKLKAHVDATIHWHEASDASLVSFSAGCMLPLRG